MTDREKELSEALRRLIRWVGFGVANNHFAQCVAPQQAEADLAYAERILEANK